MVLAQIVRFNHTKSALNIYHLPETIRKSVFKKSNANTASNNRDPAQLTELALLHLQKHNLGTSTARKPQKLDFKIPELVGSDLDSHFQKIGSKIMHPYLGFINEYISQSLPPFTKDVQLKSGWVMYKPGNPGLEVEYPLENAITFDTEVLVRESEYAVMATAVSQSAWYVWLSPYLLNESESKMHLVPLGPHKQVVVGHNIGYDRKRVKEEYSLKRSNKMFIDTMSLHIACNGMCTQQRIAYQIYERKKTLQQQYPDSTKYAEDLAKFISDEPWVLKTAPNSLAKVVEFHLNQCMDKSTRSVFIEAVKEEINNANTLKKLVQYCATDSMYTKLVFDKLLPKYLMLNPHPASLAATTEISTPVLPIKDSWYEWIDTCEAYFKAKQSEIDTILRELADEAVCITDYKTDPFLCQLDWSNVNGKPKWYTSIRNNKFLTTKTRLAVLLMRLQFNEYPLTWDPKHGWCIFVPKKEVFKYKSMGFEKVKSRNNRATVQFKLVHPESGQCKSTNPFGKFYGTYFESNQLNSNNKLAQRVIATELECAYWLSARKRVFNQMPVFQTDHPELDMQLPTKFGLILPRIAPSGTVTKRAVEDTWLTAANAKHNKLGSELKCQVQAPPGYKFVGADVDSEELWISSVIGDSVFGLHGGTALSWMELEGSKINGTDMHSQCAKTLGVDRDQGKIFNYSRIYGAGVKTATKSLRRFNHDLTTKQIKAKCKELYNSTKGVRTKLNGKTMLRGGSESIVFNQLETLANQPVQTSPVLGGAISEALQLRNLNKTKFLTTRVNWSIQTAGVDYLHLLVVSMRFLIEVYNINARLLLTVHDELRYLVKVEDQYRCSLALQIANLWTRALICEQLGFDNLPLSTAFFSLVDLDNVMRKEALDPCKTPSQPLGIPGGECLNINDLLAKCSSLGEPDHAKLAEFQSANYVPREPLISKFQENYSIEFLRAQI